MNEKWDGFIAVVTEENLNFVNEMHEYLLKHDYKLNIKPAKQGPIVSYLKNKRTIATYVFRKSGMKLRVYPEHLNDYQEVLEVLPESMKKEIRKASPCKRMINPDTCNSRCIQGYEFDLDGVKHQKCRYNAFIFDVNENSHTTLHTLLNHEVVANSL